MTDQSRTHQQGTCPECETVQTIPAGQDTCERCQTARFEAGVDEGYRQVAAGIAKRREQATRTASFESLPAELQQAILDYVTAIRQANDDDGDEAACADARIWDAIREEQTAANPDGK